MYKNTKQRRQFCTDSTVMPIELYYVNYADLCRTAEIGAIQERTQCVCVCSHQAYRRRGKSFGTPVADLVSLMSHRCTVLIKALSLPTVVLLSLDEKREQKRRVSSRREKGLEKSTDNQRSIKRKLCHCFSTSSTLF